MTAEYLVVQRRSFISAGVAVFAAGAFLAPARAASVRQTLALLEKKSGGRLGVFAFDTNDGRTIAHRASERFPMCSTFKVLAISAVLHRVDAGADRLDREIAYGKADLQAYAPVAKANLAKGRLTVRELCKAAIEVSDNTAANLLLRSVGGPSAMTAFVRESLHDPLTRLDRNEPSLNTAIAGDPRDTTSPRHTVANLATLLTKTTALSAPSAHLLESWMRACQTGADTLRATVPANWNAGDKTGSGDNGTRNDVAIFRPPGRAPIFVASYLTGAVQINEDARNATLAAVGKLVAVTFG